LIVKGSLSDNLRSLSSDLSDMEMVLFDTDGHTNMPSPDEVIRLKALCKDLGMTCTVHFPVDICASDDARIRRRCEDKCLRTVELFSQLAPFAWILHLTGAKRGRIPDDDIEKWRDKSRKSAERICSALDNKSKLCVETLDYDFSFIEDIVSDTGLSICLDIGHLIKFGYPVRQRIKKYMPLARVVHIHGVKPDGTDHVDLSYCSRELISETIAMMSDNSERVMTLEVFEDDYEPSLKVLKEICKTRFSAEN